MKLVPIMMAALLPVGVALAQEQPQTQAPRAETEKATTTKQLTANVVSADETAKTITFKGEGAAVQETTLPVESKALTSLKDCAPGDKVKLTVRTDAMGKKQAVTAIEKSAAEKAPPKPPQQP
jgi:hypothetical protein